MSDHYILDGREPKVVDLITWARWFETADRHVASTQKDGVRVSTVFLGLDHNFMGKEPHIFETMIFNGEHGDWCERCATWEQAEALHKKACALAFGDAK